nr:hypothetical protein [uncultured Desulfobacter sp.]
MNKREKIIVIIAGTVALYGIADFFILPGVFHNKKVAGEKSLQEINDFIVVSTAKLSILEQAYDDPKIKSLMSKIHSQWDNDPFDFIDSQTTETNQGILPENKTPEIIYSGFLQAGAVSLAVINDIEYQAGETIRDSQMKIIRITPQKVVVQNGADQINLYLKEE